MIDYTEEVARLFHLTREEAERRAGQDYHHSLITHEWEKEFGNREPTEGNLVSFYCTSEGVLWDLVGWARAQQDGGWPSMILNLCRANGIRTVLDYGCGLAPCSLRLAAAGYDVTLVDIPTMAYRFLLSRLALRYPTATVQQPSQIPKLPNLYDAIICTEVLEHLWEPEVVMAQMAEWLRPNGLWVGSWTWAAGGNCLHLRRNEERYRDPETWAGIMEALRLKLESDYGTGLTAWRKEE